ncbi:hypothetical protein HK100_003459 [Physocladia obscura]|uniref:Glycosyltransferase 2-like domain-containing protein n=1 Tax=Physocladia obscura TaxID=109957 RepID=A0AAD5XAG0_9FUNG|nr:hypothetical protein HK100_003459 [Physocladia obscura]
MYIHLEIFPIIKSELISPISNWLKVLESPVSKYCNTKFDELNEKPLVSVVLVHHNRHHFLKQALASLSAQTYKNLEVVVVDDGSDDPLSQIFMQELSWKWWKLKGWKILFQSNRYLGAARNAGASYATGKYVLFLDDDDYSKPNHVETLIKVAINTDSKIVTGGHDAFTGRKQPSSGISNSRFIPIGSAPIVGLLQNVFGDSAIMVDRKFFVDEGGFTEEVGVGFEDYEYLARMSLAGIKMQAVAESLHWYRHHGQSMSTATNLKTNQLRMLRPYIQANPTAPRAQQVVFEEVQRLFFEKYGVSFNENPFARRDNSTVVPIQPLNSYTVPCKAFFDSTGASGIVINEQQVWANSVKAACWNMGANSPTSLSNPTGVNVNQAIQPIYPNGTAAGFPILQTVPCNTGYSDVWNLLQVIVSPNTPYNTYTTFNALNSLTAPSYGFFNRPLVPPNSTFSSQYSSIPPQITQGWNNGSRIYYADFGAISGVFRSNFSVNAGKIVSITGAGPVASDASISSTGFYVVSSVDPTNVTRYQTGDFRIIQELTYPYVPTSIRNSTLGVLNCPFVAAEANQAFPSSHKTYLLGIQPEITTKTANVTVILWGMAFTTSSVVYVNRIAYSGKINFISNQYLAISIDFTQYSGAIGELQIYVDDSIPYAIRYYQTPATISAIASKTLYTSQINQQIISLTGSNLPQLTGGYCVFNFTSLGAVTPLNVTSATSATCTLPSTSISGKYSINVAMAAGKYNLTQLGSVQNNYYQYPLLTTNTPLSVTVYAKGPKVLTAQFSNSGASIYVDFDSQATVIDVNQFAAYGKIVFLSASAPLPCSAIFQTSYDGTTIPPTGKLSAGNSGDCFVQQLTGTRFKILLQAQFTAYDNLAIVPNQIIKILTGSLWATNQYYCEVSSSFTIVAAPAIAPIPVVSIVAPVFLPYCAGITLNLDMTATSGSAGRNYTSNSGFTIASSAGVAPASAMYVALVNFLQTCIAQINHQAVCEIPINLLWESQTYTFTLNLHNYLGGIGAQSVTVNFGTNGLMPLVTVVGVPETGAKINQIQTISALGSAVCGQSSAIQYQWSVSGNSCPGLPNSVLSANVSQVVIPPYTLKPLTTCALILKVKYSNEPTWYTATPSFVTAPEILQVSSGSSQTIAFSEKIALNALLFSDSYNLGTAAQFQCSWACTNSHGFMCSTAITKLFTGCTSNILTGQLALDSYSFQVTAQDTITGATANSSAPAVITVVDSSVPVVSITLPGEAISPYSNKFSLSAVVDAGTVTSLSNVKYSWSGCNNPTYSSIDFTNANNFLTDVTSAQVLKFAPGALIGDTRYCVAVTVVDGIRVGNAQITFETYEVPFGGFCFLQTASITEVSQPLQYSCPYWAVDPSAQPLAFGFYVRLNSNNPWTLVVPTDRSSLLNTQFTTGQYQIKVVVTDEYGSAISGVASGFSASQNTDMAQSSQCTTSVCTQLQTAIANYQQTHNSQDAAKAIGAAAVQIDANSTDFITILGFLQEFSSDVYIDTTSTGPFLASVLQSISSGNYSISSEVMGAFVNLTQSVIDQISVSGYSESPISCVDILSAESLFLVLDQALGSAASFSLTAPQRASLINSFNTALNSLDTCFSRNKAPEEYPFTFDAGYLTREIGVAFTTSNSTFCIFNVDDDAVATTEDTISYSCGKTSKKDYPDPSSATYIDNAAKINAIDEWTYELTLRGVASESAVQVSQTTFNVTLSTEFELLYGLTGNNNGDRAVCAYFNTTEGLWATNGCTAVSVFDGSVQCECNHLTTFTIGVSSQSGGGGLSVGAIVGCVIGALALVVVTAGSVYKIRQYQQQQQQAQGGSLLPTAVPPPVPPLVAAPVTVPLPPPSLTAAVPVAATAASVALPAAASIAAVGVTNLAAAVPSPPVPPSPAPLTHIVSTGGKVAAAAVVAAAMAAPVAAATATAASSLPSVPTGKPLPTYSKAPSYDYHMQRTGR